MLVPMMFERVCENFLDVTLQRPRLERSQARSSVCCWEGSRWGLTAFGVQNWSCL